MPSNRHPYLMLQMLQADRKDLTMPPTNMPHKAHSSKARSRQADTTCKRKGNDSHEFFISDGQPKPEAPSPPI